MRTQNIKKSQQQYQKKIDNTFLFSHKMDLLVYNVKKKMHAPHKIIFVGGKFYFFGVLFNFAEGLYIDPFLKGTFKL